MSSGLHEVHSNTFVRTFLHAFVSLLAGVFALVLAAFGTGSIEMLAQYTQAAVRSVEPQLDAAYSADVALFGLLLDALVGIAVGLLVFNRLHFHRWLPRKQAAQ